MSMFEDIPVDVGIIYEGERIRWAQTYVELGGPRVDHKFELVRAKPLEEVEDGKITVIGPDIKDLEKGNYPFGIYIEVAGKEIEEDLEGVFERHIHEYCNFVEGLMHLNQRYDIQLRLSEKSVKRGFNTFHLLGKVLQRLYKSELPIIEKMQITFITDPDKAKEMYEEAIKVYEARDAKARGLKDEDVDAFYGCALCQSFAPTHACIITPQRYSNCGSISWFDGRAASRVDPKGPLFAIEKGECLDAFKGEWSGANEALKDKTLGEISRIQLYTSQHKPDQELYPHTSCGCFEAVAFYIPEVDGLGIVHRGFDEATVNGLPFSTMADSTAGGRQVDGFHGISIEYMRSPKFLQVDGGWDRVVWMPSGVKERVQDFIPQEIASKIATENDVKTVDELKTFLENNVHPVVERWEVAPAEVKEEVPAVAVARVTGVPIAGGGFRIILKNATIHAERVIIKAEEK